MDFECQASKDEFTIVRCCKCGVLYLNPRPSASQLNRIYPQEYGSYHFDEAVLTFKIRNYLERSKVRILRKLLPESADVLDAGCGGTGFLERLRKFGQPGWRLWGNDINAGVLADLQKQGFKILPGKFEDLDQPASSFDAIIFKQVIEHFESPRKVLLQTARLLRKDGLVVIETPNFDAWDCRLFRKRYWAGYDMPRHFTIFDSHSLSRLARQAGLEVEAISFIASPSFWAESVRNILMDKGWPPVIYNCFNNRNPVALGLATIVDLVQRLVRGRTSNMRVVLRRTTI